MGITGILPSDGSWRRFAEYPRVRCGTGGLIPIPRPRGRRGAAPVLSAARSAVGAWSAWRLPRAFGERAVARRFGCACRSPPPPGTATRRRGWTAARRDAQGLFDFGFWIWYQKTESDRTLSLESLHPVFFWSPERGLTMVSMRGSVRGARAAIAVALDAIIGDRGLTGWIDLPDIMKPDRRIAGSPDRRIAGSPDRRIAGSPDRRIAGSPNLRLPHGAALAR